MVIDLCNTTADRGGVPLRLYIRTTLQLFLFSYAVSSTPPLHHSSGSIADRVAALGYCNCADGWVIGFLRNERT